MELGRFRAIEHIEQIIPYHSHSTASRDIHFSVGTNTFISTTCRTCELWPVSN